MPAGDVDRLASSLDRRRDLGERTARRISTSGAHIRAGPEGRPRPTGRRREARARRSLPGGPAGGGAWRARQPRHRLRRASRLPIPARRARLACPHSCPIRSDINLRRYARPRGARVGLQLGGSRLRGARRRKARCADRGARHIGVLAGHGGRALDASGASRLSCSSWTGGRSRSWSKGSAPSRSSPARSRSNSAARAALSMWPTTRWPRSSTTWLRRGVAAGGQRLLRDRLVGVVRPRRPPRGVVGRLAPRLRGRRAAWGGGESPSAARPGERPRDPARRQLGRRRPRGRAPTSAAAAPATRSGHRLKRPARQRLVAGADDATLEHGYGTPLPSGRTFGEALLDPTPIYVGVVRALLRLTSTSVTSVTSPATACLKLMRPRLRATYEITTLPEVPEVLDVPGAAVADVGGRGVSHAEHGLWLCRVQRGRDGGDRWTSSPPRWDCAHGLREASARARGR